MPKIKRARTLGWKMCGDPDCQGVHFMPVDETGKPAEPAVEILMTMEELRRMMTNIETRYAAKQAATPPQPTTTH